MEAVLRDRRRRDESGAAGEEIDHPYARRAPGGDRRDDVVVRLDAREEAGFVGPGVDRNRPEVGYVADEDRRAGLLHEAVDDEAKRVRERGRLDRRVQIV